MQQTAESKISPEDEIKPQITSEEAIALTKSLYGLDVTSLTELNAYDDRNFHILVSQSSNKFISPVSPHGYILKFINSYDTNDVDFFHAQTEILLLLQDNHMSSPIPKMTVSGEYLSLQNLKYKNGTRPHLVRLFEYLPGKIMKSVPGSIDIYYQVGVWAAKFDLALKGFRHHGIESHNTMWHLNFTPKLYKYLDHVREPSKKALVKEVLDNFCNKVVVNLDQLEKGVIHGDMNEQNILVDSTVDGRWEICTILDLGDVNHGCYLYEIAAAMCYMMLEGPRTALDPLYCGAATVAGYRSVWPLNRLELSLLKVAVCARMCQSLVLGLYTESLQPGNNYVLDTQENGWTVLTSLWNTPTSVLANIWSIPTDM